MFAQFLAAFQFAVGVTLPSVLLLLFGFFKFLSFFQLFNIYATFRTEF